MGGPPRRSDGTARSAGLAWEVVGSATACVAIAPGGTMKHRSRLSAFCRLPLEMLMLALC